MKYSVWNRIVILGTLCILFMCAAITIYVDPLFHYHGMLDRFQYMLEDERYQNDGIVRNFDYDAIITGSSMCENFSTTQFDILWETDSVKAAFAGGSYKEIDENLKRALKSHNNIKYVVRSIDYSSLMDDKNDMLVLTGDRPSYLYDDNPFNDVRYLFNKEIFINKVYNTMAYTKAGGTTTSFDSYAFWGDTAEYGGNKIYEGMTRRGYLCEEQELTDEDKEIMLDNINQNILSTVSEYPDTIFYLFFTPYSISYWDIVHSDGLVNKKIEAERVAIEEILKYPNVRLYSFNNDYDLVCDLDNYKDQAHFGPWVNSKILSCMKYDMYRLTSDNYKAYIEDIRNFYENYDYETLNKYCE